MKNQKHLFAYHLITALFIILICNGCGRTLTGAGNGEYNPEPCAEYQHGTVRYENVSKNAIVISCKSAHSDILLNPRSYKEMQRISAGSYELTYKNVGKKKGKTRYEAFYVTACETEAVTLK